MGPVSSGLDLTHFFSFASLGKFPFVGALPRIKIYDPPMVIGGMLFPSPLKPVVTAGSPTSVTVFIFFDTSVFGSPSPGSQRASVVSVGFVYYLSCPVTFGKSVFAATLARGAPPVVTVVAGGRTVPLGGCEFIQCKATKNGADTITPIGAGPVPAPVTTGEGI